MEMDRIFIEMTWQIRLETTESARFNHTSMVIKMGINSLSVPVPKVTVQLWTYVDYFVRRRSHRGGRRRSRGRTTLWLSNLLRIYTRAAEAAIVLSVGSFERVVATAFHAAQRWWFLGVRGRRIVLFSTMGRLYLYEMFGKFDAKRNTRLEHVTYDWNDGVYRIGWPKLVRSHTCKIPPLHSGTRTSFVDFGDMDRFLRCCKPVNNLKTKRSCVVGIYPELCVLGRHWCEYRVRVK